VARGAAAEAVGAAGRSEEATRRAEIVPDVKAKALQAIIRGRADILPLSIQMVGEHMTGLLI